MDNSVAPTIGTDNSEDDPDNPTMARAKAIMAQVASGANPDAVLDVTVKWYVDVLGFPESNAKAMYTSQMLTDEQVLVQLTDKSVDIVCVAIRKPGGASKGDPTPVLSIERLKLTVFYLKLYERTSKNIPDMTTLTIDNIISVRDQKRMEDEYLSSIETYQKYYIIIS